MVGKTKAPTKAERRRMDTLKHDVGCIACRLEGFSYVTPDIHHLLDGGRRRGHAYTIPLCPWHHRGMGSGPGVSMAHGSKPFREMYGPDDELLEATDALVEFFNSMRVGGE